MTRRLTDMEAMALGVIARHQPCTAYQVQRSFLASPSLFFSGSAGAIYPLVNRMKRRGFILSAASSTGKRKSELLTVSREGRAAFNAWLDDTRLAADAGFDPIRARLSVYPDAMDSDSGRQYLERLLDALEARLEHIQTWRADQTELRRSSAYAYRLEQAALEAKIGAIRSWLASVE